MISQKQLIVNDQNDYFIVINENENEWKYQDKIGLYYTSPSCQAFLTVPLPLRTKKYLQVPTGPALSYSPTVTVIFFFLARRWMDYPFFQQFMIMPFFYLMKFHN